MELSIISKGTPHASLPLRRYRLDGIDTVGVVPQEPFGIRFRNSGGRKIQVRLSIDGTDVLTGDKATTEPTGRMWIVDPYDVLSLEAWPESTQGGARFVFGEPGSSVATHTHGDTRAIGYISAAVFTESYQPPRSPISTRERYPRDHGPADAAMFGLGGLEEAERSPSKYGDRGPVDVGIRPKGGPATGAGEYVEQRIGSAQGLIRPVYAKLVQIRYVWWEDMVLKLREQGIRPTPVHPTGFEPPLLANLGSTPRPDYIGAITHEEYSRYA